MFRRKHIRTALACLVMCGSLSGIGRDPSARGAEPVAASDTRPERVQQGLQALYDLRAVDDSVVEDRSGAGERLDLRIENVAAVRRSAEGLEITGPALIRSEKSATRLTDAIRHSGAITLETWVRPARTNQSGPARILTLSRNSNERNFTLAQDGEKLEVRLRTTKTSTNGIPALTSKEKSVTTELTHVVYTRDNTGRARIYINGQLDTEGSVEGTTSNWNGGYELGLANELSNDRPWLGVLRLAAIYNRDLTPKEVEQNFQAGANSEHGMPPVKIDVSARLFEMKIAPLMSKHCLECHDSATKKGKLDLSRKASAISGGRSGAVLVPGKSAESALWQMVASDEMPHNRPPLSSDEKELLRKWLDGGGTWSLDVIDPAVYVHGEGSNKPFVQRLTVPEYIETVRSTVGVDITKEARELLPRDLRADGFSNTAYNLNVDLAHVEAYAKLAEIVVGRMDIKSLAAKHTKSRELTDENLIKVIEPIGKLLLRGPLGDDEVQTYCGISTTVAGAGGNFEEAVRYILEAMLQSPRFVYRIEKQSEGGSISNHELASRLSYILWGGPPDSELMNAADKGTMDRATVASQVQRMLRDRRAVERSRQFIFEWLDLGRLDHLRPSPKKFPNWNAAIAADMKNETLAFFEEIVWKQNRPLADLLNARITFVTPRLAKHYALPLDTQPAGDEPIRYDLSPVPGRGGLLSHGSVLTVGGDEASMVTRGLFVMHELLRGVVKDPPPCVDTTPVPTKPGLPQRAIAESRLVDNSCTGCHSKFEPLAFGLEKFDGVGTYHEIDEHGNKLRDDGNILFPGGENSVSYQSSAELMDLLAGSERVRETLTWKVTQFALGRPLGAEDAPIVADIRREHERAGGTYTSLMTAIVASGLVQTGRTETIVQTPPEKPKPKAKAKAKPKEKKP